MALNVSNASPYDYGLALDFLTNFDLEIEIANPGAAQLLIEHGVDPVDVAHRLSTVLPSIVSTDFNPNGSSNAINASMLDLQAAMARATPFPMTTSKEDWLAKRGKVSRQERRSSKPHGKGGGEPVGAAEPTNLAVVPAQVPELPDAYLVRQEDLAQLKKALLIDDQEMAGRDISLTSKRRQNRVGAHGMVSTNSST